MPKFSVKKPLTVFVAVLAIVVLGVVAYLKMTPDLMPNMDFPYVILVTTDPGASPETVEADITKPLEQSMAQERSRQIAREWSAAMEAGRDGRVRDFVAVGDVDIKVIGADNQVLDSEVPVRQILEQLVARTGIPPFLLGLSWSSTERMSTQQADMMTSELTAIRRGLEPVVERICELWLALHGYDRRVTVDWEDINLQDLVEEARAELYREQAEELRLAREGKEG